GVSPLGVSSMAGNVVEWLRNPFDDGFTTAGGGWNDPVYQFESYGPRPALYSDATLGLRCVMNADGAGGDQGSMRFTSGVEVPRFAESSASEFRTSKAHYAYEKTGLNATVLAIEETAQWRREEIAFDGYGGNRVKAFLYLPKNAAPPYQLI